VLIGDEADRTRAIIDFRPTMHGLAMVTPIFQAANQFVGDLGNRIWDVNFVVARPHASRKETLEFLALHPLTLPQAVDLKIEQDGGATYLVGAVMTGFTPLPKGLSSECSYNYTGIYTTVDPDAAGAETDSA